MICAHIPFFISHPLPLSLKLQPHPAFLLVLEYKKLISILSLFMVSSLKYSSSWFSHPLNVLPSASLVMISQLDLYLLVKNPPDHLVLRSPFFFNLAHFPVILFCIITINKIYLLPVFFFVYHLLPFFHYVVNSTIAGTLVVLDAVLPLGLEEYLTYTQRSLTIYWKNE